MTAAEQALMKSLKVTASTQKVRTKDANIISLVF
jgi:hypothetical protein